MATKLTVSKSDLQWQAESDARVLEQYQMLMGDKQRLNRAMKEAQRQASDLSKRVNVLKKVAKKR
jgi:hypothetical protein